MSDSNDLMTWIEGMQEKAYIEAGKRLGFGPDATKAWEHLTGKPATTDPKATYRLPTRFEQPDHYHLLTHVSAALQSAMGDKSLDPAAIVATMPTGDINAKPVTDPFSGIPVVFFEQGLLQFLLDYSNAVGWALPPLGLKTLLDDEALFRTLSNHRSYILPSEAAGLGGVLNAYVVSGTPLQNSGSDVPFPPHNQDLVVVLHLQMLRFIVAHELGHLALEHSGSKREYEYEADDYGALLSASVSFEESGAAAAALWAADASLSCLTLLHKAMAWVAYGPQFAWISETHPDEISRRQEVRGTIGALEGVRLPSRTVDAYRELLGMSDSILDRLAEFALLPLGISREAGIQPYSGWQEYITASMAAAPGPRAAGS